MTTLVATSIASCVLAIAMLVRPRARVRALDLPGSEPAEADGPIGVLEDVGRDLRSGGTLHMATAAALRRHHTTLVPVREALASGGSLTAALAVGHATDAGELLVLQTLRACERTGGRMGAAVDRAIVVLRERRAWGEERHAQAAQARLSATVMTLVPMVFAAWGVLTSNRIRDAYTHTPVCAAAAGVGLVLNVAGWLWMRRLITGVAS